MKKIIFVFITVFVFSISVYAAEPKKVQTSNNVWQGTEISSKLPAEPNGDFAETPCFIPDGDTDFFACTGIHKGRKNQNKEEVKAIALASALDMCSNKMIHTVRGLLIDYLQKDGNSNENKSCICRDFDEEFYNKTAVSEVAQVSCVKYSVEKGIVTAYVGIKVPRKEVYEKVKELEKRMYPEKNPTNVKEDDEAISEEEKQMIEMIEKRLKEAEEKDKTEQRKKK